MMNIFSRIYAVYAACCFVVLFLLFSPIFLIGAQRVAWHQVVLKCYRYWAALYFPLIFIRTSVTCRFAPAKDQQYLVCANHFSFFDIPSLVMLPFTSKFIGKSSLTRVPLFGYMFRKIHIAVDRASLRSRADTVLRAREALDQGFNLSFFPEGGIFAPNPPQLYPFRDGAFRLAVERQLPIVPVVLPNNHRIFPDDGKYHMHPGHLKVIVLPPLFPQSEEEGEIARLRNATFEVIQNELDHHNNQRQ